MPVTLLPAFCPNSDAVCFRNNNKINPVGQVRPAGSKGIKSMKKATHRYKNKFAAAALASVMMAAMTSCAKEQTKDTAKPETSVSDTSGTATPVLTDDTSEVTYSDEAAASHQLAKNAYGSYITVLESLKAQILSYSWMDIGWDDSNWMFPSENIPCAFEDLTGDGIEELIVMKGEPDLSATLEVYSYDRSTEKTSVILTVGQLNNQTGSGRGIVVALSDNGRLIIADCPRTNDEYSMCLVYSFNGTELIPDLSITDVVTSNDEYTEFTHSPRIDDNGVTMGEYMKKKSDIVNSIDKLFQYAFVCDEDYHAKLSGMTSEAMSYNDAYKYLLDKV